MAQFVSSTAILQCSFGLSPCTFNVIDPTRPKVQNQLIGNIMDNTVAHIPTFGMCQCLSNPSVAAATAAAMGALTPMPCVPVIAAPWSPGSAIVKIANLAALTNTCQCMCSYGGIITVNYAGNAGPTTCN